MDDKRICDGEDCAPPFGDKKKCEFYSGGMCTAYEKFIFLPSLENIKKLINKKIEVIFYSTKFYGRFKTIGKLKGITPDESRLIFEDPVYTNYPPLKELTKLNFAVLLRIDRIIGIKRPVNN